MRVSDIQARLYDTVQARGLLMDNVAMILGRSPAEIKRYCDEHPLFALIAYESLAGLNLMDARHLLINLHVTLMDLADCCAALAAAEKGEVGRLRGYTGAEAARALHGVTLGPIRAVEGRNTNGTIEERIRIALHKALESRRVLPYVDGGEVFGMAKEIADALVKAS